MTDHGPHTEQTAPARAAVGCVLVAVESDWTAAETTHLVRSARWLSEQRVTPLAVSPGVGRRAAALQLLQVTTLISHGVDVELKDRRVRDLRAEGWTIDGPPPPVLTTLPTPIPPDSQGPPSSLALPALEQPHVLDLFQSQLVRTLQRMSSADLARLRRKLARLKRQIQRVLDRLLGGVGYEFVSYVPPHDTSPCGLPRMASPEIPRGPQPGLHLDAPVHPWALAA
ncbi:hypothetical protein AW27_023210 [Streptomyces sp. PCS3-D2]|uniref:hypothetical protein n=1 Tax=Streptomyces sp. PCS3-D2 TaxID=1460244 RepID=UPI0012FE84A8|nr:hypothetical protein [Streptomyces sp. PCS3-D2]WKV74154.1 hypothetical protein AW27_023210 [Streptomyces sp. PCS3-D2]